MTIAANQYRLRICHQIKTVLNFTLTGIRNTGFNLKIISLKTEQFKTLYTNPDMTDDDDRDYSSTSSSSRLTLNIPTPIEIKLVTIIVINGPKKRCSSGDK